MELKPVTLRGLYVTGPKEEIWELLHSHVLYGTYMVYSNVEPSNSEHTAVHTAKEDSISGHSF